MLSNLTICFIRIWGIVMERMIKEFMTVAEELRRLFFSKFEDLPLPKAEFMFLKLLNDFEHQKEAVTATMLSRRTKISKSAISQTAGSLERKGYIIRQHSAKDRRKTCIGLTEAGRAVLVQEEQEFMNYYGETFDRMGKENCRQLIGLLRQFIVQASVEAKK